VRLFLFYLFYLDFPFRYVLVSLFLISFVSFFFAGSKILWCLGVGWWTWIWCMVGLDIKCVNVFCFVIFLLIFILGMIVTIP
jgi:hypothetical protein